jgi:hypothetical protein
MNDGRVHPGRHLTLSGNKQVAIDNVRLNLFWVDAGQSHQYEQLVRSLQYIDRRFPDRGR